MSRIRCCLPLTTGNIIVKYIIFTSLNTEKKPQKSWKKAKKLGMLHKTLPFIDYSTHQVWLTVSKMEFTEYSNMNRENQLGHSSDKFHHGWKFMQIIWQACKNETDCHSLNNRNGTLTAGIMVNVAVRCMDVSFSSHLSTFRGLGKWSY